MIHWYSVNSAEVILYLQGDREVVQLMQPAALAAHCISFIQIEPVEQCRAPPQSLSPLLMQGETTGVFAC